MWRRTAPRFHPPWQPRASNRFRNRRTVLPHRVGDLFLREMKLVGEAPVGDRLFDGIQVLALDVLDQRDGEKPILGDVADDDRHLEQPGPLSGAPAALPRDDLVTLVHFPDDDRLDDAVRSNRARQLVDPFVVHVGARLELVGTKEIGIDFERAVGGGRRGGRRRVGDQRAQAAAERRTFLNHAVAPCRHRAPRLPARGARARA